jgi:hypothetical protein
MDQSSDRLDGTAKVLVVATRKPLFPEVVGNAVVVSDWLMYGDLFTTAPVFCFTCPFHQWREGPEFLSRDIPDLPVDKMDEILANLDRRGIIKCGSVVRNGDILVGKIAPGSYDDMTADEKLLASMFGRARNDKNDESLYYYFRDPGVVSNVEILASRKYHCASCGDVPWYTSLRKCPFCDALLTGRPSDNGLGESVLGIIKVDVVVRRKLSIGDVLNDGKGNEFTVARIIRELEMPRFQGESVDVLVAENSSITPHLRREGKIRLKRKWHKTHGDQIRLEKVTLQSSEKMMYRGQGPTNSFSLLPISSDTISPGQKVDGTMLQTLFRAGYSANVRELLSIKADSVDGKAAAYAALVKDEPVPFGIPDTSNRLWALLKALCFNPCLLDGDNNEVDIESISAERATLLALKGMCTRDVRQQSYGQVLKSETYSGPPYRAEKHGLFCERIFGPERDWQCACGKYQGIKYKGVICDRCGVKIAPRQVRRERFGHINLPMMILHPWYIKTVSEALGLSLDEVEKVLLYQKELDAPLSVRKGPLALKEYLEQKGVNTGCLFLEALPVLPAGLRPMWFENGRAFAGGGTWLYRRVVGRSNRLAKLCDLNAPQVIIDNEHRELQQTVSALFLNEMLPHPVLNDEDSPLHSLRWELDHLLKHLLEKRVEYSGRMIVIPNTEQQRSTIGVPAEALYDLYKPLVIKELKARGLVETIKSAKAMIKREAEQPRVRDALAAAMANRLLLIITKGLKVKAFESRAIDGETAYIHPDDASELGIRFAGEQITLHLPLTDAAMAELREPHPTEDGSSALLDLNLNSLTEMVYGQTPLALKSLDKIALGIGQ